MDDLYDLVCAKGTEKRGDCMDGANLKDEPGLNTSDR